MKIENNSCIRSRYANILRVLFFALIIFTALKPWFYKYPLNNYQLLPFLVGNVIISILFTIYWLKLLEFPAIVRGPKEQVYKKLDSIQFANMNYMNLGFKSRGKFIQSSIHDTKVYQIFSERYDSILLVFSFFGIVLLKIGLGNSTLETKSVINFFLQFSAFRGFCSALGAYVMIWSLSLYFMGFICKSNCLGAK